MAMLDDVGLKFDQIAGNWTAEPDDPVAELRRSVAMLTKTFVDHGRLIQAISDTARHDPKIRALYRAIAERQTAATSARIQADVEAGRSHITAPGEVARALIWMNERYLLACFGQRPFTEAASDPALVTAALTTIWVNTLYGPLSTTGA